jgi:hypothetical protein
MAVARWTAEAADRFTRANVRVEHAVHERAMFGDEALAALLDRYPRERLGVFTMGEDPEDWGSWRRGEAGDLTGAELLAEVRAGRLWLNLRAVNANDAAYAALSDEIFAEVEKATGRRCLKRDLGLLISSPKAQVFYHFDAPLVMLWQLRGRKRVWVYPPERPFLSDEQVERLVLGEAAEQVPYDRAWDHAAEVFDLAPGHMVSWPQNAPHRVENGDMLNLSLSIEFMTPEALLKANVAYANGLLRKTLGRAPAKVPVLAKAAMAYAHKLMRRAPRAKFLPAAFRLGEAG